VGLLSSARGPRGGFSLVKTPEDVTLLDIYEAIEGPVEQSGCLFSVPLCEGHDCILGHALIQANDILKERLVHTTLADTRQILGQRGVVPRLDDEEDEPAANPG